MSRYESSKFIKDPKTMNQDALKQACDTLGWKYKLENNVLYVTDAKQSSEMYGEYVLKVAVTLLPITVTTLTMVSS